ncbi:UPF0481 protein At3g47200-like [Silene latifolia]|uniref:UPF0481 protein At3g47200-like n=1 Tax=Silene latifolia TaxID=37657 RepID=UPI003D76CCBA
MAEDGEEIQPETLINNNLKMCIYKVPDWLKEHACDSNDQTPYEPEIVSFGPYHWGNTRVKEMEKHKRRCLDIMLNRNHQNVDEYLTEMKKIEKEVRTCYKGQYENINDGDFAEMLVLDGCFMLEFLRINKLGLTNLNYVYNDPVFSKNAIMKVIARDMIKLENQIPLTVLEKLLSLQYKQPIKNKKHIPKLVLQVLNPLWITNQVLTTTELKTMRKAVASDPDNMLLHCLDIFRSSLLYKTPDSQTPEDGVPVGQLPDDGANTTQTQAPVNDTLLSGLESERDLEVGLSSSTPVRSESSAIASTSSHSNTRANTVQTQAPVNDTLVWSMESEHDAVVGLRPSTHVRSDNPSTTSPSNTRLCPPDNSSSDGDGDGDGDRNNGIEIIRANSTLMVYCVKELVEAGVTFKMRNSQPFWDLKFNKCRGLLQIPPIKINDATKTLFLNLVAYEQCHLRRFWEMSITDYVAFMDNLVSSEADVSHLYKAGIIVHQLGSDAEVADLFNRLVKKAFVEWEDGNLSTLYKDLNRYCSHRIHRWCASWRSDYWKNPWVFLSVVAAILLFGATIAQTVYSGYAHHNPPKPPTPPTP